MLTSVKQYKNTRKVITFEPMLEKKYNNIVYYITLAIIATIGAQVYWNVKNYEVNKQQVTNIIQTSFDNAIEKYFIEIAEKDILKTSVHEALFPKEKEESNLNNYTADVWFQRIEDSVPKKAKKRFLQPTFGRSQTIILKEIDSFLVNDEIPISKISISSIDVKHFTSKLLISLMMNNVKLEKLDSLFLIELQRKNITINHQFILSNTNHITQNKRVKIFPLEKFPKNYQSIVSNSSFINKLTTLKLHYTNTTTAILKRMLGSIFLSFLLSGIIIGCLFFLLHIISKQKQLSEVKNDLISNITHEFKTPITTIKIALESIENFNAIEDKAKTKNYLNISNNQLSKLNIMVEKLLETATLNSNNLTLNKEKTNIVILLETIIEKYKIQVNNKVITFYKPTKAIIAQIDVFHFENAVSNILDNALKYGGDTITVLLNQEKKLFNISISDDGNTLTKKNKEKIFEQFYRVSKGNTHDVKGFGIGLYYAKKIIENHKGSINLELKNNLTTFKISIPYA